MFLKMSAKSFFEKLFKGVSRDSETLCKSSKTDFEKRDLEKKFKAEEKKLSEQQKEARTLESIEKLRTEFYDFQKSSEEYEKKIDALLEKRNSAATEFWKTNEINFENAKILQEQTGDLTEEIRICDLDLYNLVCAFEVVEQIRKQIKTSVFANKKDNKEKALEFLCSEGMGARKSTILFIDSVIKSKVSYADSLWKKKQYEPSLNIDLVRRMHKKTETSHWEYLKLIHSPIRD